MAKWQNGKINKIVILNAWCGPLYWLQVAGRLTQAHDRHVTE